MQDNNLLVSCGDQSSDSVEALMALIEDGADVSALTEGGESALHLSCIWNHPDKIAVLLKAGADPNVRSSATPASLDMTPLTWCVYGNHYNSVKEFLSDPRTVVNMVVRQEDGSFITALDIAMKISNDDIVTLLLGHGAKTYAELI
ncbi:unnamed protein product, partial [Ectocarpus fasciculatus]